MSEPPETLPADLWALLMDHADAFQEAFRLLDAPATAADAAKEKP